MRVFLLLILIILSLLLALLLPLQNAENAFAKPPKHAHVKTQQPVISRIPIRGTDISHETWVQEVVKPLGLPEHVEQHLITMAVLHRAGRYERATGDVEQITGQPASTVGHYVAERPDLFS